MTEAVNMSFKDWEERLHLMIGIGSTLPPGAAVAVAARVCEIVAEANPGPEVDETIVRSINTVKVVHAAMLRRPAVEVEKGYNSVVEWWARSICEALYPPVIVAVVEGHLRNVVEHAKQLAQVGEVPPQVATLAAFAATTADDVLVPSAQSIFS